jgi:hypothetical protein
MKSFSQQAGIQGGLGAAFPSHAATFPHYAIPQGLPYHVYGYLSLSPHTHTFGQNRGPVKLESHEGWGRGGTYHMHDMCIVTCHLGQW